MKNFKLCLIGYTTYIILNSIFFIIDALKGHGGSGEIFSKFWLPILILSSILILVSSIKYLLKIAPKMNRAILIVLSILVSFLQIAILVFIFFFFAVIILAPILSRFGFYITMP